jgi:large repetitive protein
MRRWPGLCAAVIATAVSSVAVADRFENVAVAALDSANSNLPDVVPQFAAAGVVGAEGLDRRKGEHLSVRLLSDSVPADGKSTVLVTVDALDARGQPLQRDVRVTLQTTLGRVLTSSVDSDLALMAVVVDKDRRAPGVQVLTSNGRTQLMIQAPAAPGIAEVIVSSGNLETRTRLSFVVELRPLLAVGLIDGIFRASHVNADAQTPTLTNDGMEDELQEIGVTRSNSSIFGAEGRAAMFAKGQVGKGYLLTMAVDTDKDRTRFFRDIQPDQFYPIYGDASIHGFDAQSTRKGYLRIDRNQSYFLFGDFNTEAQTSAARSLGAYQRTLTGGQQHFESKSGVVNLFAAEDSLRRVIDEQPGRGISGPYQLSNGAGVLNSEQIEIVVRDRNQPAVVLDVQRLARFSDYEFEPFSGQILFRRPIPTVDSNLNPVSVRVTYEVESGGPKFWVAGANAQWRASKRLELGGSFANDSDPLTPYSLYSANMTVKLGSNSSWLFEAARSQHDASIAQLQDSGNGYRSEYRYAGERLSTRVFWGRTDAAFDNPTAALTQGRNEAGAKLSYDLTTNTDLTVEASQTEDVLIGADRTGATALVGRNFSNSRYRLDLGLRYGKDQVNAAAGANARPSYTSIYTLNPAGSFTGGAFSNGAFANGQIVPNEFTTVHSRFTANLTKRITGYVEGDSSISNANGAGRDAWAYAFGTDYMVHDKTRLYLRHEESQSLAGIYGLGTGAEHSATLLGLSTSYHEDSQLFSEYRLRDAIEGRESEAAMGLRNLWRVREGLAVTGNVERLEALDGTSRSATALAVGVEYTGSDRYKSSARLERRSDSVSMSYLSTLAWTAKLSDNWSFLARNLYNHTANDVVSQGTQTQDRAIVGLAYRDTATNVMSSLMRYELKTQHDTALLAPIQRLAHIVSYHTNYKPGSNLTLSSELAGKWVQERVSDSLASVDTHYRAQLLAGRAIYDLNDRWDIGANTSWLRSDSQTSQYGLGLELGRIIVKNLWASVGYNFAGFTDRDLVDSDYTRQGVFLRLRYKFDERLFGTGARVASPVVLPPPAPTGRSPSVFVPLVPRAMLEAGSEAVPDSAGRCSNAPSGVLVNANGCEPDSDRDGIVDRMDHCPGTAVGDKVDEAGCSLTMTLNISFDTNSADIASSSYAALDSFAGFLLAVPSARGEIEGHTDNVGSEAYNMRLSLSRAESVRAYVTGKGVDASRLSSRGYGSSQPVADNQTEAGRAQNRRVVFTRIGQP